MAGRGAACHTDSPPPSRCLQLPLRVCGGRAAPELPAEGSACRGRPGGGSGNAGEGLAVPRPVSCPSRPHAGREPLGHCTPQSRGEARCPQPGVSPCVPGAGGAPRVRARPSRDGRQARSHLGGRSLGKVRLGGSARWLQHAGGATGRRGPSPLWPGLLPAHGPGAAGVWGEAPDSPAGDSVSFQFIGLTTKAEKVQPREPGPGRSGQLWLWVDGGH